jgi:hypothetical protein
VGLEIEQGAQSVFAGAHGLTGVQGKVAGEPDGGQEPRKDLRTRPTASCDLSPAGAHGLSGGPRTPVQLGRYLHHRAVEHTAEATAATRDHTSAASRIFTALRPFGISGESGVVPSDACGTERTLRRQPGTRRVAPLRSQGGNEGVRKSICADRGLWVQPAGRRRFKIDVQPVVCVSRCASRHPYDALRHWRNSDRA